MNTTPFYYMLVIAEEKSFSKAAKKLGISQPALSSYVNKLENKLGAQLFDRAVTPIELTEFGEIYLEYVRDSYLLEAGFEKKRQDLENLSHGNLVIGGAHSFTMGYLPKATAAFKKLYPGVDVRIVDARVPELTEMALNGELDCFLTGRIVQASGITLTPFIRERMLMCMPSDWEAADELAEYRIPESDVFDGSVVDKEYPSLPVEKLKELPFVLLDDDLMVRIIVDEFFASKSVTPKISALTGQIMTSFSLMSAGVGMCFMSDKSIRYGNIEKKPALFAIDRERSVRELSIAVCSERYVSRACKEYMRVLCETYKDI